ncbi:MAG: tetratricopeptide repeat protein [Chloroflexi bacterium]|nr:tetratricopeptide repeat protein [Chloroflexota bacterium]
MVYLRARIPHILIGLLVLLVLSPSPVRRNLVTYIEKARTAAASGDPEAALDYIDRALLIDPGLKSLELIAAEAALATDHPERAIPYLNSLSERDQDQEIILCLTAEMRAAMGQYLEAFMLWEQAENLCSERRDFLYNLADHLVDNEKFSMAERVVEHLSSLAHSDPELHFQLAALTALRDPEQALIQLRLLDELSADNQALTAELIKAIEDSRHLNLMQFTLSKVGQVFAKNFEWSFAAQAFRNALDIQPDYSDALSFLGLAIDELGQDGLSWLKQAERADPIQALPHINLAVHWLRNNAPQLALFELEQAAVLDPSNPIIPAQIAQTYEYLGDINIAIELYRAATELAPKDPNLWLLLAQSSSQNNFDVLNIGLPAARNAAALAPDSAAALDTLGYSYYLLGDLEFAGRFLFRALAIDSGFASTHYHLGLYYAAQLDMQSSIVSFEMAVILDPESVVGQLARRTLETLQ